MQDEAWPGANAKTPSYRSVELNGERPAVQTAKSKTKERLRCHHVQLNVVETSMGWKGQRERERKNAAKGSHALSGFGFLPKAIVVRRRPERDGNESAAARGRRQLFAIVPPATRTRRRKLFAVVFIDLSEC